MTEPNFQTPIFLLLDQAAMADELAAVFAEDGYGEEITGVDILDNLGTAGLVLVRMPGVASEAYLKALQGSAVYREVEAEQRKRSKNG